jgi:hypothetical protein
MKQIGSTFTADLNLNSLRVRISIRTVDRSFFQVHELCDEKEDKGEPERQYFD